MALVVSDTGPIRYLIEIGAIETLPQLFNQALIPDIVLLELVHASAPATVREFFLHPPPWLQVRELLAHHNLAEPDLDAGEVAAIALGLESGAELVLLQRTNFHCSPKLMTALLLQYREQQSRG